MSSDIDINNLWKGYKDFKSIHEWYNSPAIQFELIRVLYNREFSVLVPSWYEKMYKDTRKMSVRNMRAHNSIGISWILNSGVRMFEKKIPYNLYYSLARFKNGIPPSSLNFSQRNFDKWNKEAQENIVEYDFLLDIDAGEHEDIGKAFDSAKLIVNYFNKINVPFEIVFSGKGFHIKIPYIFFPYYPLIPQEEDSSIYSMYSEIARNLSEEFSEMIDTNIYDSRRLCKIPCSLALYQEEVYVCYQFKTIEEFENFKLEDYSIGNFKKSLLKHGRTLFNDEGNVRQLFKDFSL